MATLEVVQEYPTINVTEERTTLVVGEFAAFSRNINDMNQIETTALANGDYLVYNSTSGDFENQQLEKATLTKTFTAGEEYSITLSEATTTPIVSATYETPQTGLTNNTWDVETTGSDYDIEDFAKAHSLTPSATTGAITLTLDGVGVWTAADVGKRVVGNGGVAIITSQSGTAVANATTTIDFTDTSAIASGLWALYGLNFDATNGVEVGNIDTTSVSFDFSTASYDTNSLNISGVVSAASSMCLDDVNNKIYILNGSNDSAHQYSFIAGDISSATSDSKSFSFATQDTNPVGITLNSNKNKVYICGTTTNKVYQYSITAGDISTASYDNKSFDFTGTMAGCTSLFLGDSDTKLYITFGTNIYQFSLSVAGDISTASYDTKSFDLSTGGAANSEDITFSDDGLVLMMVDSASDLAIQFDLSTTWDISTAGFTAGDSIAIGAKDVAMKGIFINSAKMYIIGLQYQTLFQYTVASVSGGITSAINQYFSALTNATGQIDTTYWTDINSMTATENLDGQTVHYTVSTDDRTTWQIVISGSSPRNIVRNNAGTWEYNSNATYGSETWTAATTNTEHQALAQAMTVAANKMTGAQLGAVGDAEHFTLTTTLDLAIILYSASSTAVPSSDGVAVDYDGNIVNTGALPSTNYTWDAPTSTSVRFTAVTAGNYKVRII